MSDENQEFEAFKRTLLGEGDGGGGKHGHKPQHKPQHAQTRQSDQQYKRQDDRGDAKRYRGWTSLVRIAALIAAILGMYISAQFSVDGFSFTVVSDRTWIGWGVAGIVIIIQMAWQKFGDNLTIFVLAIVCYGYSITTNVLGITGNRPYTGPEDLVIPIIFGALLDIFPEPFLAWAISGDISSDPLKKFVDRWS